jgi:hypothetical protein
MTPGTFRLLALALVLILVLRELFIRLFSRPKR